VIRSSVTCVVIALTFIFAVPSVASASPGVNGGSYTTIASNGDTMTILFPNQTDLGKSNAQTSIIPALSANYFSWTATISCCITSRQWTSTSNGAVTIKSYVPCDPGAGTVYTIALYRFNTQQSPGQVNYTCGQTLQYTWNAQSAGDFSFRLQKRTDGVVQTFSGSVYYP
jgi:hypothetical protein